MKSRMRWSENKSASICLHTWTHSHDIEDFVLAAIREYLLTGDTEKRFSRAVFKAKHWAV